MILSAGLATIWNRAALQQPTHLMQLPLTPPAQAASLIPRSTPRRPSSGSASSFLTSTLSNTTVSTPHPCLLRRATASTATSDGTLGQSTDGSSAYPSWVTWRLCSGSSSVLALRTAQFSLTNKLLRPSQPTS